MAEITQTNTEVDVSSATVESNCIGDFAAVMNMASDLKGTPNETKGKINLEQDSVKNGLGQLVLTLVKLLHELLERQALRRIEAGSLSDPEIENIGVTLMRQAEEIERLRKEFGLEEKDLNLDLGPLGK
ncbi:MAG: gas vesicle protein K, partial [Desulfomonilaceae bacterium]